MRTDVAQTEKLVSESIARNMAKHVVSCLHREGTYRHYRCKIPGTENYYFDIITWPGYLCFAGDLGEYVFSRERDMIAFMGRVCGSDPIDYRYAAEKCRASRGELMEFSEQRFRERLIERLDESLDDVTRQKIRTIRDEWDEYQDPNGAIRAMHESGLWDGCDLPTCKTYTFQFVLCIHCIRWFCERLASGTVVEAAHA